MTASPPEPAGSEPSQPPRPGRHLSKGVRIILLGAVAIVFVALVATGVAKVAAPNNLGQPTPPSGTPPIGTYSHHHVVITLPDQPASYLGMYVKGVPGSYAPVRSFTKSTGVQPNIALYYSGWLEGFRSAFAVQAKDNGAVPLVQIDPSGVSLAGIAVGAYDTFLETFATEVASYGAQTGHGVIISFGHEMNGDWYSWGNRHTSPAVFVAAWRHIVNVFRQQGADDVTWLWTVNIVAPRGGIPSPGPWWPGRSYVTWVGIDGYYLKPSWTFAPLFGPTIKAVLALSRGPIPILIAETGAAPTAGQPAKVTDLFAGIRAYGLLGFVWFDATGHQDFRLTSPAAFAAFSQGAKTYERLAS